MALIKCPECGVKVSSSAASCPKCAYPIAGGGSTQAHGGNIQTIEQTSKRYKLQHLLATLIFLGSIIAVTVDFLGDEPGSAAGALGIIGLLVGSIWIIIVKFLTWWHHA